MTAYGGSGIVPSSLMTTRFGPSAPRLRKTDAAPGPPLNAKQTGRVSGSASFSRYAMVKIAASGSPRFSSSPPAATGTNAATVR